MGSLAVGVSSLAGADVGGGAGVDVAGEPVVGAGGEDVEQPTSAIKMMGDSMCSSLGFIFYSL